MKAIYRMSCFAILMSYFLFSCKPKFPREQDTASKTDTAATREVVNMWWHTAKFDSAFAYLYEGRTLMDTIVQSGKLHSTVRPKSKRQLSEDQIREICGFLDGTVKEPADASDWGVGDCFIPSQGFVFYSNGVIQAHVSMCYVCNRNVSVPAGHVFRNECVAHIFEALGLPVFRDEETLYRDRGWIE